MVFLSTLPTEIIAQITVNCENLYRLHALALTCHRFLNICLKTPSSTLYKMFKETYPGWLGEWEPELFLLGFCKAEQLAIWAQDSSSGPAQVEDAMVNLDSFCCKVRNILPLIFKDLIKVHKCSFLVQWELALQDCMEVDSPGTVPWRRRFTPAFAL